MKEKNLNSNASPEINKIIRKPEDIALKNSLLAAPELFVPNKESDEYLDKLHLKIQLIGGKEFTLGEYISENLAAYRPRFYKDYFFEVARLMGIEKAEVEHYHKPQCVAEFTIQFIYGRFPRKVLNTLRIKSGWTDIPGIRKNKLFQYLTITASDMFDLYIDQAVEVMKSCSDLLEFKLTYSKKYGIYFQIDMFADASLKVQSS